MILILKKAVEDFHRLIAAINAQDCYTKLTEKRTILITNNYLVMFSCNVL